MPDLQPGQTVTGNGVSPMVLRQSGPSRESMLADMAKLDDAKPPMKVSTDASEIAEQRKGAAAAQVEQKAQGDATEAGADADPPADEGAADRDGEGDAGDEPAAVEAKPEGEPPADKEMERRRKAILEQERRSKEQLAERSRDIETRERDLHTKSREVEARAARIDAAAKNARKDPWPLLKELGFTEDDAEYAAKVIYANSKAAAADPKNRAAIDAEMRRREHDERLATLERENREMRDREQQRAAETESSRIVNDYLDGVVKTATAKTAEGAPAGDYPLARAVLANNPAKARAAFHAIAHELAQADSETPTEAEVLATYEQRRAAELRELGIDPKTIGKPAPAAGAANPTGTGKSRTLGGAGGATAVPSKKKTAADERAEIVRALEEDKLDL